MIPPIGNLILSLVAILGAYLYPQLPGGAPFDSDTFVKTLQWLLIVVAGWNVKAAAVKSALPTFRGFISGDRSL